jgi:rhodanese-related sulfurtransferase
MSPLEQALGGWQRLESVRTAVRDSPGGPVMPAAASADQEEVRMNIKSISPLEAQRQVAAGAVLVDIQQPYEMDREKIEGAIAMPLTTFRDADRGAARGRKAIFFCQSGGRTMMYAGQIEAKAAVICDPYVTRGGILGWRKSGLPTVAGARPPRLLARLFGR